jgi:multidrug efflux pump subunit AcrA (membrane-fusion protein)
VARVGQAVAKGDLLAEIENPELLSDLRLARLRLELARRRSAAEGQRGLAGKTRLRVAEAQLAAAVASRNGALARSRSAAEANEGPALERARRNAATIRKLAEQRLATAAELDAAEAVVERERENLAVRRESRARLAEELAAAENQAEAANLQLQALRAGTETSWEIEIAEAAAAVKRLERRAHSLRVIAPVDGVVAFARAAGSAVAEGELLFRIGDTATLTLEVPATAALAREVREGDKVTARIPVEPPAEVDAYVSGVEWAPESGQAYLIRVSVNNPERGAFLAGLEGTVAFRH